MPTDAIVTAATVPDVMVGCWRRAWISFADGRVDHTSSVVWLQTASRMADVRIAADRPDLAGRTSLGDCTDAELRAIAQSDASSGYTTCEPMTIGHDGRRAATATWHTRGHGVNFQPVTAFPEPGLMTWNDDATVMTERAPSGAYVEEWHLVPGSRQHVGVRSSGDGTVYRAGDTAVFVRDRAVPIPRPARLPELLDDHAHDRSMMEALLDCEFSVAERIDGSWVISASTFPWRHGKVLDVDLD